VEKLVVEKLVVEKLVEKLVVEKLVEKLAVRNLSFKKNFVLNKVLIGMMLNLNGIRGMKKLTMKMIMIVNSKIQIFCQET
jgi:hypothetical protein